MISAVMRLKSLVRRYPVAVALNFMGLVSAFLAFALIFLQVDYELSFDKCHPTAERVFRADKKGDESLFRNILPRGFADDIVGSSAHIEAGCALMPFYGETYFSVGDTVGYRRNLVCVSEGFLDVFGLNMVEGGRHSLELPASVIIPRSLAQVMFPGEPAVGKVLKCDAKYLLHDSDGVLTVSGVYEDFPSNTQLGNDLYVSLGDLQKGSYGGANFVCYLLLDDKDSAQSVADEFNEHFDFSPYGDWLTPIELVPLTDIYFRNEGNVYKSGSRAQLLLLIAIAILILAVGLINFINFYVALTPLRIRNVNLQKILGASDRSLRLGVVFEAVVWCACAFALSALLLSPVSEALAVQGVLMQAFSLAVHWKLLIFIGMIALLTGLAAGVWPAVYLTSGQPAMVLRGNFGLSSSGRALRSVLVGVQFVVSMALLIFVLALQRQSRFMQEYPCGYDKEDLLVVDIGGKNGAEKSVWLRERLCRLPEVEDVAYAMELIGGVDMYSTMDFGEGPVQMSMLYCSYNLPRLLGLELTDGRDFKEGDLGPLLLTDGLKSNGAELRDYGGGVSVVGFVNNVNITSLRKADSPVGFQVLDPAGRYTMPFAYIRIAEGADKMAAGEKIRQVLSEMDPTMPFELKYYSSIGRNLYSGEERLRLSVWLFSLLVVLLSLVGVWGQMLMDVQYKRREISVKRVFGADVERIAKEGLLTYLRTLAVCYVIAAPLGWIVVNRYIQQFAHRVGFSFGDFALAFAVVALLCAAVVLWHYLKAARTNPASVLKNE